MAERRAVIGSKTTDGKPAYYKRGPHNKQGSEEKLVLDSFLNNLLGKKVAMEM